MKPPILPLMAMGFALPVALNVSRASLSDALDYTDYPVTTGHYVSANPDASPTFLITESSAISADGVDAVQGRLDTDGRVFTAGIWLQTQVQGPTTLYFSWRTKNFIVEQPGDFSVTIGGLRSVLSSFTYGNPEDFTDSGWQEGAFAVPAGLQTVRWTQEMLPYVREDVKAQIFVDQVWTANDTRPRILDASPQIGTYLAPFTSPILINKPAAAFTASGLPPGLSIDAGSGVISGTPTAAGLFYPAITASSSSGGHRVNIPFFISGGATSLAEALDEPGWTVTATSGWVGVTGIGHAGNNAAWCRNVIGSNPPLTVAVRGPGTLSYWYKMEQLPHEAAVYLNTIPPVADWTQHVDSLGPGVRSVTFSPVDPRAFISAWAPLPPGPFSSLYLDDMTFTPTPIQPQATFSAWKSYWGNDYVGDSDGIPSLLEYAFGGNPIDDDVGILPRGSIVDGHLTIDVIKAPSPTDLTYIVQNSVSLAANSWTTSEVEVLEEDEHHLLARCKKSITEAPKCYLRAKVIVTP